MKILEIVSFMVLGYVLGFYTRAVFAWAVMKFVMWRVHRKLKGAPHDSALYKFEMGRRKLSIKPGEAFNAKITWPGEIAIGPPQAATCDRCGIQLVGGSPEMLEKGIANFVMREGMQMICEKCWPAGNRPAEIPFERLPLNPGSGPDEKPPDPPRRILC